MTCTVALFTSSTAKPFLQYNSLNSNNVMVALDDVPNCLMRIL